MQNNEIMAHGELAALLMLNRTPGIRMTRLKQGFEEGIKPSELLRIIEEGENEAWKQALLATRKVFDPEKELARAEEREVRIIGFGDPQYPCLLKEVSDPPFVLYVSGDLIPEDEAALAIVGSRHPSLYGVEQARRFARGLAESGLTIVSGFAKGIDRAAHEGALQVPHGRTLAVLGSGLDVLYPKDHEFLQHSIREKGALLSEFAFGTPPLAENFPKRNRIIAGLSLGVVVVEAHSRSGSLITAHLAADEGREVFALPGRVDQLGSRGTHRLIKEGACLTESPEEVLECLSPHLGSFVSGSQKKETEAEPALSDQEKELLAHFSARPLTLEKIAEIFRQTIARTVSLVSRLEIKGRLRRSWDGKYHSVEKGGGKNE